MSGFVDIHSHILPGVDDGARTIEESMQIAGEAARNGVTDIVATPHYGGRYGIFERSIVKNLVNELNFELKQYEINVKIHPGAEIFCSPDIIDLAKNREIICLSNSNYLLIDLPFNEIPFYLQEMIFQLKLIGLTVVLAHVERNTVVQSNPLVLDPLINQGALVQVNSTSISGLLGKQAKNSAVHFAKNRKIDVIASDSHSMDGRLPNFREVYGYLEKLTDRTYAQEIMMRTPSIICGIV